MCRGLTLRQSFVTWQVQSDTSAVRKTPCTGSLLEVKLVPAVYSRDKQHRTNQIKKGGTRRNTGYPSRKDIFPTRKSNRIMLLELCLRTTARTYRLVSVLSHKRIAPANVLHRQTRVRTLESSILRLRSAIMLNAVRQKHWSENVALFLVRVDACVCS